MHLARDHGQETNTKVVWSHLKVFGVALKGDSKKEEVAKKLWTDNIQ